MAKSKYKNVRQVIASLVCDDDFAVIDAAMKQMGDAKLVVGPANANIGGWGKADTDLQEDLAINGTTISGTSKYVEDYTSAGFKPTDHHFIYVKVDTTLDSDLYELSVGITKQSVLDDDKDIVLVVANNKKPVKVQVKEKATGEIVKEETYTLDLTFAEQVVDPNA